MTNGASQSNPPLPAPEPGALNGRVPVGLFVLLFILLYWGMVYFDQNSGWFNPQVYSPYSSGAELQAYQPSTGGADLELGRSKFEEVCALCHNVDGAGKPNQAPPLAGSEWVQGSPNQLIRIPLSGLTGPVQVKGQVFTGATQAMPAMGATMTDEQLAAVLSYMRSSWGNKASPITPEQVKAIRAQVGNRGPWTADELKAVPQ